MVIPGTTSPHFCSALARFAPFDFVFWSWFSYWCNHGGANWNCGSGNLKQHRFCGWPQLFFENSFKSRLVLFERELPVTGTQATLKVFFTSGICVQTTTSPVAFALRLWKMSLAVSNRQVFRATLFGHWLGQSPMLQLSHLVPSWPVFR